MKKIITTMLLALTAIGYGQAPAFKWANNFGTNGINSEVQDMYVDTQENIYISGAFGGTQDFDFGSGVTTFTSNGGTDVVLAKYDSDRNLIWAHTVGGPAYDDYTTFTVSADGYVYFGGAFKDSVDFDPTAGVDMRHSIGFGYNVFLQKLDATTGSLIFTKTYAATIINKIVVSSTNQLYVLGAFGGTVDLDPGAGVDSRVGSGGADRFIQKFSADGTFLWVNTLFGKAADWPEDMEISQQGNLYVYGQFSDTVDFNPTGPSDIQTTILWPNIYVQKMDTNGNHIWVNSFGGREVDYPKDMVIDANENIYMTGSFEDTVNFNPTGTPEVRIGKGYDDAFIRAIDANGNFLWVNTIGQNRTDVGYSLAINNNKLYTAGKFRYDSVDFDNGPGVSNLPFTGTSNGFLLESDLNGNFLSVLNVAYGSTAFPNVLAIHNDEFYLGGQFRYDCDFNPDLILDSIITSAGSYDGFISKLGSSSSVGIDRIEKTTFNVYPNPSNGNFNIEFNGVINDLRLTVLDLTGKIVLEDNNVSSPFYEVSNKLKSGVYLLQIENKFGNKSTKRVIINK